jgi:hypothetical protein
LSSASALGWPAWANPAAGGGSFNNFNDGNHQNGAQPAKQIRHFYHQASDFVMTNLDWLAPLVVFLALVVLALWLVILWLNCRGKFMFLHCVAWNKAEVEKPWTEFAAAGNSLFRFRLVLGLIGFIAVNIIRMILHGEPDLPSVMLAVGSGMLFFLFVLIFVLIRRFTVDFVVPIMYLRRGTCLAAWREFLGMLSVHPGQFTLYILFRIVLGMAITALVLMAYTATCCIACCLAALPFVGTVLLLPVIIFKRAYPLYYLAQFGPQYDVFPTPPAPPAPSPSPLGMPPA